MAGHRRDVENLASDFRKKSEGKLAAQAQSVDVDAPHFFPAGRVPVADAGEVGQAGGIDENVELIQGFEGGPDGSFVAKVTGEGFDALGELIDRAAEADHGHSPLKESLGDGLADSGGGSGDECGFHSSSSRAARKVLAADSALAMLGFGAKPSNFEAGGTSGTGFCGF